MDVDYNIKAAGKEKEFGFRGGKCRVCRGRVDGAAEIDNDIKDEPLVKLAGINVAAGFSLRRHRRDACATRYLGSNWITENRKPKTVLIATESAMPDWGKIFADPEMQRLAPNPEFIALLPEIKAAGCRRVLDAGCGVGRQLLPLVREGFRVWGVDCEAPVLQVLQARLQEAPESAGRAGLVQGDLSRLPFAAGAFDLVLSINVINHGYRRTFEDFCRELDRVLKGGGRLFIYVSPREFAEMVRLPQTRELEPGTLVDIASPDGGMVHHFPTAEELQAQFAGYRVHRLEIIQAPIPFMGQVERPQLVFWGEKPSTVNR